MKQKELVYEALADRSGHEWTLWDRQGDGQALNSARQGQQGDGPPLDSVQEGRQGDSQDLDSVWEGGQEDSSASNPAPWAWQAESALQTDWAPLRDDLGRPEQNQA